MAGEEQDVADPSDNEVKARESGWVPKEEFKGKPEHWTPPDVWIAQHPKVYIPELKKTISKLEKRLADQEQNTEGRIKRLEGTMKAHYQAQIDGIRADYEGKKEKAVETGDTEAYKKAVADEKRAVEGLEKKVEAAEDKQELKDTKAASDLPPEVKKRLESFLEDNDWYSTNRRLQKNFDFLYAVVEEEMPGATIVERLDEARNRLVEANPEKFGKAKKDNDDDEPRRGSRVESGSRNTNNNPKKKGWSDIDSEDRRMAESMIGEGKLFKDKSDYAVDYWKAQDEDARA